MKPINKYLVNRHISKTDGVMKLTEEEVRSYIYDNLDAECKKVTIRYEHGEPIVDIVGKFIFKENITEIPFQFGEVTDKFNCSYCENLTSLKGCPKKVGGNFNCFGCKNLKSLEGCPKEVGGHFYCYKCGREFTEQEVRSLCDVHGEIHLR